MANKRINDLPNEETPSATDRIAIDGATTRSTPLGETLAGLAAGGTLPVDKGGTNLTSYAVGDLLYATGATTLAKLAGVATGNVLKSGGIGAAPAYGKVDLSTDITGSPTSLTIAMGADNATGLTIQGAGANNRLTVGSDGSGNALIRSQNSGEVRFGINTTDWFGLTSAGVLAARSTGAFQGPTIGVATNSSASAGQVGEDIQSSVASGAAVALTTNVGTNITSIALTAGDWDVWCTARFTGGATTTVQRLVVSISQTSATLDAANGRISDLFLNGGAAFATASPTVKAGPVRISLAATTTIYLVVQATFGTSTCLGYGIIEARRRR